MRVHLVLICSALLSLGLVGCSAYSKAISRGDELARQGQWEAAETAYLEAESADPKHPETQLRIQNVRNRRADEWVDKGEAARNRKELDEALHDFAEAVKVAPANPRAAAAYNGAIEERLGFAEGDLKAGALESAERHANAVLQIRPDIARAQSLAGQIQMAYAQRSFATAEEFEKKGLLGNALVEYLRADERKVGATPAREHAEVVRKKLREELMWFVAAPPVTDRTSSPDVAQRIGAGRLGQAFGDKLPITVVTEPPKGARGVRVSLAIDRVWLNRDKTSIQRTQRYLAGMKAVPNPERAKNEQQLLYAERNFEEVGDELSNALKRYSDAQSAVDRARDSFDRCTTDAVSACQRSIDDCRSEAVSLAAKVSAPADPNQPQQQPQAPPTPCQRVDCTLDHCNSDRGNVTAAEKEQTDRRRAFESSVFAVDKQRREIQRLRDLVYRTPLTVEEPMYSDFVYDIDVHTLHARALVTLNIDDLQTEPSKAPFTQEYEVAKSDETHKGYDRYGILVDPLVLPNELDVRTDLGDKALADVTKRVRARFDVYRNGWLQDARRSLPRAGAEDATETLVKALFVSADTPPKDIVEAISRSKGIQNPLALLAQ
ncbi:MAG: outer membrane exchange accessory lipoprotein TraC [Myxococcaceae bacterium]